MHPDMQALGIQSISRKHIGVHFLCVLQNKTEKVSRNTIFCETGDLSASELEFSIR